MQIKDSVKMCAKNATKNTQQFILPISQFIWNTLEKMSYRASVVCNSYYIHKVLRHIVIFYNFSFFAGTSYAQNHKYSSGFSTFGMRDSIEFRSHKQVDSKILLLFW